MQKTFKTVGSILGALLLTGCASTHFTSTWKAPDAAPIGSMHGQKVAAFVLAKNMVTRRAGEDALAAELTRRGALGIAGYTLVPDVTDEAKAKAIVEKAGVAGVVAMRPIGSQEKVVVSSATYGGPSYGRYWGGYYNHGWGGAYTDTQVSTYTIVSVETLVYSLRQNKLIWGGQSQTTDPSSIDAFVLEIVNEAAKEMKKAGVL